MWPYKTGIVMGYVGCPRQTNLHRIGIRYWLDFFKPRFVSHRMSVFGDDVFDLICQGKKIVRRGRPFGNNQAADCAPQQVIPVEGRLRSISKIIKDGDVLFCSHPMNCRSGGDSWYAHDAAVDQSRRVIDMYPDGSCDLNFSPWTGEFEPVRYDMSETRKGFVLSPWPGNRNRKAPNAT